MGSLTHIMFHCADTPASTPITEKDILRWHTGPKPQYRGWKKPGYAGIWLLDGSFKILVPFDEDDQIDSWEISNGAIGWNGVAKHFCTIGGSGNQDTRTPQQLAAQETFCRLALVMWPDVKFIGHNQVNLDKYCPSYSVPQWCESIGIPFKNIDYEIYY